MKQKKLFGISQKVPHPKKVEILLRELITSPPKSAKALEKRKCEFAAREKINLFQNRDLIVQAKALGMVLPDAIAILLQKRSVRTISGVSPIGVLTKAYPCPGKCVYCPTEERMPKSYLKNQPAAARAFRNKFHPYDQVKNRILALEQSGHPTSKLEIIVMGGTWSFLPQRYQTWFIKKVFEAANEKKDFSKNIIQAQKENETAEHKVVGITLETRPDFITEKELVRMRNLGCTRIEIGVQTLDDEVQKLTKRGHFRKQVADAMKLMKDFGFKVCFHLMPGLPGSNPEKDLEWMKEIFENSDFKPDFVKLYPCVVLPDSELQNWWKEGKYKPYDDADLIKLLLQWQVFVPRWTRIMRLMRDIPVKNILEGAKFSNLRQILRDQPKKIREIVGEDFYKKHDIEHNHNLFRDIRAREVGFSDLEELAAQGVPILKRCDYEASGGKEVFLSYESLDEKHLFALLRLRKPSGQKFSNFKSVLDNAALIREVHSYGGEISVGEGKGLGQHRGFGKKLIIEAERIAREEWGLKKIMVISGVGTRGYYRKFGYKLKATYMTKKLI